MSDILQTYRQEAWHLLPRAAAAVAVAFATWALARLLSRAAARVVSRARGARGGALAPIARLTVFLVVVSVGGATALGQLGVNVAAIVASAGVVGVAVGFGAQTLVKDCLTGFFMMLDDVLGEGDVVTVDGVTGVVERVGLRVTQVRTYAGQLIYFPNGELKRVGNWNRGWVRAIAEVGVAYEQDVARGMNVLRAVGEAWAAEHAELVIDPPEVQGVMGLNASDVTIRLVIKIKNDQHELWPAERELRRRIKGAFDEAGVEIPFARSVVYLRPDAAKIADAGLEESEARASRAS